MLNTASGFVMTLDGGIKPFEKPKVKYHDSLQAAVKNAMRFDALKAPAFNGQKFDESETRYLQRELTYIIEQVMEEWTPDYTSKILFPVNNQGGPGIRSMEYAQSAWVGEAEIVSKRSNTMPYVDYEEKPYESPVQYMELGWKYTWYELQEAIRTRSSLDSKMAMAARKGTEKTLNDLAYGLRSDEQTFGVPGLFNQPDRLIKDTDVAGGDAAGFLDNTNILTNTGPQNVNFLLDAISVPHIYTEKMEAEPDTIALPIAQAKKIMRQPANEAVENGMTVAQYILANTGINQIIAAREFSGVNKNGFVNPMLIYRRSSDIVEIRENHPFTIFPSQQMGLHYSTPTNAGTGGLFVYYQAMAIVKDVNV